MSDLFKHFFDLNRDGKLDIGERWLAYDTIMGDENEEESEEVSEAGFEEDLEEESEADFAEDLEEESEDDFEEDFDDIFGFNDDFCNETMLYEEDY